MTRASYLRPCTACGYGGSAHDAYGKCLFGPGVYQPMTKSTFTEALYYTAIEDWDEVYQTTEKNRDDLEAYWAARTALDSLCTHPRRSTTPYGTCAVCRHYVGIE